MSATAVANPHIPYSDEDWDFHSSVPVFARVHGIFCSSCGTRQEEACFIPVPITAYGAGKAKVPICKECLQAAVPYFDTWDGGKTYRFRGMAPISDELWGPADWAEELWTIDRGGNGFAFSCRYKLTPEEVAETNALGLRRSDGTVSTLTVGQYKKKLADEAAAT